MRIFRSSAAPFGPVDPATFAGQGKIQRLAQDETGAAPVRVYRVTFHDGSRTKWHTHAGPQWLFIVEGRVRVHAAGISQDLDAGDAVVIPPGERHWHGSTPGSSGTHIAVNLDIKGPTIWMEPVSDEEYAR